jgi:CHAD domain-containing protein
MAISGLSAEQTFTDAAAIVVGQRSREVFAKRRRVLDLDDIERLHAMRVATRRLRAALEVFGPCLPPKRGPRALRDVKRLADALGVRRDLDVQIETLTALAGETDLPERAAIGHVLKVLRADQRRANRRLAKELKRTKRGRLRRRLQRLAR